MIKNDPVSELPVSYFDYFSGVLNNYKILYSKGDDRNGRKRIFVHKQ